MAKCTSCSAPLPANSQICSYCGVRNDIDIRGKHAYRFLNRDSLRICPECQTHLQTIRLDLESPLEIERCETCYGLFFDPGDVEALLNSAVSPVSFANLQLLDNINKDRYQSDRPIKYQKCPVCQLLMNRVAFGHRSGVVIDQCKSHGVWLDGGEISHLLEWKKAGGQLLDQKKQAELQQKKRRSKVPNTEIENLMKPYNARNGEIDLLESVASVIFKVFK